MGKIEIDHTGSGGGITLSSDGTSLLLGGTAVGGGSANAVPTTTVPVSGQTNNWTVAIGQNVLINVDNNKSSNVGIGYGALELAEDVRTNVAVGGNALRNNGTASFAWQNTAIGVSAGSNVTGGTNNIFMGYNCGGAISGGGQNIIIGAEAYLNKTGSNFQNNVIIGYKAGSGSTQTSPNDQILIGQQAGYNATSGAIAIGNFAVSGNGGFQSVGIGHRALNSGGYIRNTAVGHYCMLNADQTAQENTAMGYYALKQLTTGDGNVAIGNQTALNITTGSYNTLVGNYAGDALTTPTANTFIGQNSGGNITTGSKNTIIGIFNGNQHGLDIRTSSNNIVLSDGDGNPRVIVDGSGNLLAGKTSSATNTVGHELKVNGTAVHTTDGITPFYLNRKTTDGVIAEFRKDNTTVGTIGVVDGDNLFIGSSASDHAGFYFNNTNVKPYVNGAVSDNTMNIGASAERFKDIFISGGIHLGGTGAANKLDDYEAGSFYPVFEQGGATITMGSTVGFYTKVGRLVHCSARITTSSWSGGSGTIYIAGLPFTSASGIDCHTAAIGPTFSGWSNSNAPRFGFMTGSSNKIILFTGDTSDARSQHDTAVTNNGDGSVGIIFNVTYTT